MEEISVCVSEGVWSVPVMLAILLMQTEQGKDYCKCVCVCANEWMWL